MFLPTTLTEMQALGWTKPDIVLVTGDAYIDSPFIGVAVIGKVLQAAGYKVGIIAQPELDTPADITRLGEPRLFWGITSGCVDSMVANYTALKKPRRSDDYTPGGCNTRRPDRAVIAYANLIRRYFKSTVPVVLGGIEASLRRIAHYDYWDDALRRSLLFDAKADLLIYGMGEKAVLELADTLTAGGDYRGIKGLCYPAAHPVPGYLELPPWEEVLRDKPKFISMFELFYHNQDPVTAHGLTQKYDSRYLVHNPPQPVLSPDELDAVYNISYTRAVHPYYKKAGPVKALETIAFSLTAHRGCYGECNFCGIAPHQGRTVVSRSEASILREARILTGLPGFKGYIWDVGGPTANMYGIECARKQKSGACRDRRCLWPEICKALPLNHARQVALLRKLRRLPGIKKVFVTSGVRHDMVLKDSNCGRLYLQELVNHHISGQLKLAPEHTDARVLQLMGKPDAASLLQFKQVFTALNKACGKRQFLTYYLIAGHPGCGMPEMAKMKAFIGKELRLHPEQVQIFTPLPSTWSAVMYYTGLNPFTRKKIIVEKTPRKKAEQKNLIVSSTGKGKTGINQG